MAAAATPRSSKIISSSPSGSTRVSSARSEKSSGSPLSSPWPRQRGPPATPATSSSSSDVAGSPQWGRSSSGPGPNRSSRSSSWSPPARSTRSANGPSLAERPASISSSGSSSGAAHTRMSSRSSSFTGGTTGTAAVSGRSRSSRSGAGPAGSGSGTARTGGSSAAAGTGAGRDGVGSTGGSSSEMIGTAPKRFGSSAGGGSDAPGASGSPDAGGSDAGSRGLVRRRLGGDGRVLAGRRLGAHDADPTRRSRVARGALVRTVVTHREAPSPCRPGRPRGWTRGRGSCRPVPFRPA